MLRLLVSLIAVTLIQVLTAIGLLLQWAPTLVRLAWRTVALFFTLTCAGYRAFFELFAQRLGWWFLVRNPWRSLVSGLLSVGVVSAVLLVTNWGLTMLAIVIAVGHGLLVGVVWERVSPPRSGQILGR
jgi:hypothetical protein